MAFTTDLLGHRNRGPQFAVQGTIRPGEFELVFADTAAHAEQVVERMRADGRRGVQLHPPQEADFVEIARTLQAAREQLETAKVIARAAAHRMADMGISESETARQLGVDRMTVRSWLGKR